MMMSNKMGLWVMVSGLWAFYWLAIALDQGGITKVVAFGPLILGWGVWLVRR